MRTRLVRALGTVLAILFPLVGWLLYVGLVGLNVLLLEPSWGWPVVVVGALMAVGGGLAMLAEIR